MLHRRNAQWIAASRRIFWSATATNSVAAIWGKLPEEDWGVVYAFLRQAGGNWSAAVILVSTAIMGVAGIVYKYYGSQDTWETLHELISDLQQAIFKGPDYQTLDSHKVTIFRGTHSCASEHFFKRLWFWFRGKKRWLVPVARSHHTSQATSTCFALLDDGEKCTGVAGQAWARKRVVAVNDLPDVSGRTSAPYKREIESYASRAFVSKDWVERQKPKGRSILAVPLFVKGEPWGVLVFDSRLPQKIRYDDLEEIFTVIQKHINRLLTKHL